MNERFQIIDNSEDRKYFTIIPNYIINHSSCQEQSLYLIMKKIAGEKGSCWKSPNELGKMMKCSSNTVRKYLQKLVNRGWIKKIGQRKITKPTNEYVIVDLWKLNSDFYKEKESSNIELSKKKVQSLNLESSVVGKKEEPIKEEPIISTKVDFVLNEKIEQLLKDKKRHIQIIGLWIKEKDLQIENKEQLNAIIKRNLRPAQNLIGYKNQDIIETIKVLKNTSYLTRFTLETVGKYIEDVKREIKKDESNKIIRWEEVIDSFGKKIMRAIYLKKDT